MGVTPRRIGTWPGVGPKQARVLSGVAGDDIGGEARLIMTFKVQYGMIPLFGPPPLPGNSETALAEPPPARPRREVLEFSDQDPDVKDRAMLY